MRIHFIAIGGSIMHNLAMELQSLGHHISGSDDDIYEPALSRLEQAGLLPQSFGWNDERVTDNIDLIILGMHAQKDNPELIKAQQLGLKVQSFPEYIAEHIVNKTTIVVTGSHGKTTTTAMIMYVLKEMHVDFDYLVGGLIDGFERMVRLSPTSKSAVVEGDEYLSSRLDDRPKMLHYKGDIIIITGVAWDHMNVFPTYENYLSQFRRLCSELSDDGRVFYDKTDVDLTTLIHEAALKSNSFGYGPLDNKGRTIDYQGALYPISVFGQHNRSNMHAALLACQEVGVSASEFLKAIAQFKGVDKRLMQVNDHPIVYRDFAHAPSKVKATVSAIRETYTEDQVLAVLELHTYSSLSKSFIPLYHSSLDDADIAIVFFDPKVIEQKRLSPILPLDIHSSFNHPNLIVVTDKGELIDQIIKNKKSIDVFLLMSSGNLGGVNVLELIKKASD